MAWQGTQGRTNNAQWKHTRDTILTRDHHTCICGNTATQVDHVTPVYQGGTDDPSNLVAICEPCHKRKSSNEGIQARIQRRKHLKRAPLRHPGTGE